MIEWLHPSKCIPPHEVVRPWQVDELSDLFSQRGWGVGWPNLAGYRAPDAMGIYCHLRDYLRSFDMPCDKIQLLSGTHRHAAAARVDIKVPVRVYDYAQIADAFGDVGAWTRLLQV